MSLIEPPVVKFSGNSLHLRRASNGGWMVYGDNNAPGYDVQIIASFSDTDDMLSWLHENLKDYPKGPTAPDKRVGL